MSYYDPWAHALEIFITRVFQFAFLTFAVGLSIFACLFHFYFDENWSVVGRIFWNWKQLDSRWWNSIIALCISNGFWITALIYVFIYRRCGNSGDRHHRGARLINGRAG